jgi:hypothetical protein
MRFAVLLIGSVLLATAEFGLDKSAVGAPSDPTRAVVITRSGARLPAGCAPGSLAAYVDQLFEAFNSAKWQEIEALFAPTGPGPEDFKLVSWERDVVQERDQVALYLATLRDRGERFRLLSLRAVQESRVPASVGVDYVFERPAGLGSGKALIDCRAQKVWQLAMGPRSGNLALPCPRPAGWSVFGPIVACTAGPNGAARAADFRLESTSIDLPKSCRPGVVKRRVSTALASFNVGRADVFAQGFATRGEFHPYTVSIGAGFVGRTRIARFVNARYRSGDGWTATRLQPPRGSVGLPKWTVYGLSLRLTYQDKLLAEQVGAKLVIDCASGLFRRWIGPSLAAPVH